MRLRTITLTISLVLLSGCGKALEEFVRNPRPVIDSVIPVRFEGKSAIKVSPGSTFATSSDVSLKAHVTITDRPLTGSDVAATVSVGRHRDNSTP